MQTYNTLDLSEPTKHAYNPLISTDIAKMPFLIHKMIFMKMMDDSTVFYVQKLNHIKILA